MNCLGDFEPYAWIIITLFTFLWFALASGKAKINYNEDLKEELKREIEKDKLNG